MANAPSVSAYPLEAVAEEKLEAMPELLLATGNGALTLEGLESVALEISCVDETPGLSISATGLAALLCLTVGAELQPVLPAPKGESDGGADAADSAERAGAAGGREAGSAGRAAAGVELRVPLATPLNNSSMGSSRWA